MTTGDPRIAAEGIEGLQARLHELRRSLTDWECRLMPHRDHYPGLSYESARNLIHYLALRSEDLRPLQRILAAHGLSSLARSESHVMANVDAVVRVVGRLLGQETTAPHWGAAPALSRDDGRAILEQRATTLFGDAGNGRPVRIMVTAPDEAATRYTLVRDLVASGMNCLRINCAHGDPVSWKQMIDNVRRAEQELGRTCRILMDLAGPRLRTGAIEPGPQVVKVQPRRDSLGWVTMPAEIWLTAAEAPTPPPTPGDAVVPLPAQFLALLSAGDRLDFRDARNARRNMSLVTCSSRGCRARLRKTAYITTGTLVVHRPIDGRKGGHHSARVGDLPPIEQHILLTEGDKVVLTRDPRPGRPAQLTPDGRVAQPARIPCVPAEALRDLAVGDPIWLDEGRIGGRIISTHEDQAVMTITSTALGGSKLGGSKGINLPKSALTFSSLTAEDAALLPFIAAHADLVGYSFVRTPADVEYLYRCLDKVPQPHPGVVLKIETVQAFQALAPILLEALRRPCVGVMIARGDLAVECGFERLAEVQEEILWLCEAAHVPVIWATQVLEGLAKRGLASRAEVTDAAVGERAECVMLNKGPFIVDTVSVLNGILERMHGHQDKKQFLLRRLRVVEPLIGSAEDREATVSAGGGASK